MGGEVLLRVEIPALPPSVNRSVRYGRGMFYDSAEKKQFKKIAVPIIRRAYVGKDPYSGKCALTIILCDSSARRWDIDNRVKVVQDCLGVAHEGAAVIKDDTCIWDLRVKRFRCRKQDGSFLILELEKIDAEADFLNAKEGVGEIES